MRAVFEDNFDRSQGAQESSERRVLVAVRQDLGISNAALLSDLAIGSRKDHVMAFQRFSQKHQLLPMPPTRGNGEYLARRLSCGFCLLLSHICEYRF